MIEADVILKGQGTPRQALTPIISDFPTVDGDFTLKMWLQRVKKFPKGIKLDFRTIDAVEMSLQLLKGMKDEVRSVGHFSIISNGGKPFVPSLKTFCHI